VNKALRTRQYILDKTAAVFNVKGYFGTSLFDLTKATGLSKGALYGNFSNKEEIAMQAFQYSMDKVREAVKEKLHEVNSCSGKLNRLFDFYAQYVFSSPIPGGCPLMNNAVEADDHNLFIKNSVALETQRSISFMEGLLEKGRKTGEFSIEIKPKDLALTFFCSIEGAIVISRISTSNAPMKAVIRHCKNILEQISL
jgi:TetR/AcrR family transcriptional regulator, transcriptional repressor for nem operon